MASKTLSVKGIVYASLMGALTAAGAFIIIPLPPVPITAQTFFLNIAAILLGGPLAALSQMIYILLGVIGMPVFSGGKAGLGVLFGPTGGYLIGFVIAAFVTGTIIRMKKSAGIFWTIFAMFIGMTVIYGCGVLQLAVVAKLGFKKALAVGVLPFIPGDAIKILLAAIIGKQIRLRIRV
ncbi:MAG: biotin transporter BioY [Deltaproteobacteria bacterium]|nr:biotin transporter BioY [Deltaproteobacteria bacterium]